MRAIGMPPGRRETVTRSLEAGIERFLLQLAL